MTVGKYASTVVGALACQKNSYLKSFQTKVVNCQPHVTKIDKKKKEQMADLGKYEVELEDTILFPEGGGQPSDVGEILVGDRSVPVYKIIRSNLVALHVTPEFIEPGTVVDLRLDWQRRFDHMQQHTGQHLLSAVLDRYVLETLSWQMGELVNYIELPRRLTDEEVEKVSAETNQAILDKIQIEVEIPKKEHIDTSHMPEDYDLDQGVLRLVKIGELDHNPCCGTHLANTAEIGAVALFHQVNIRGTNSRLFFTCGDRIRRYAVDQHNVIKKINGQLSCSMDEISEKISILSASYKKTLTRETNLMKELAGYKAGDILNALTTKDVAYLHKGDAGLDFISQVSKQLQDKIEGKTVVLLCGEGVNGGAIIMVGPKTDEIGAKLKSVLTGLKGGGKGKFQGKIAKFDKGELESALMYLESLV